MSRTNIVLGGALAVAILALAVSLIARPAPGLNEERVRSIVGDMISESADVRITQRMSSGPIDRATLDPMIESYLTANPQILDTMAKALSNQKRIAQLQESKAAIAALHDEIFNDPDQVVLGNPDGDVTLVEMFDYNCGYCRSSLPDMAQLLADDPQLRVVLKEFPILSQGSVEAARIAVAAHREGVDYWAFHTAMFSNRGQNNEASAVAVVQKLGLNAMQIKLDAAGKAVSDEIQKSYNIAQTLKINGTPSYIIGDEIISGAVGLDRLKERIANMRACGSTICDG